MYSQGIHGSGARNYTPEQYRLVVDMLKALDLGSITVTELSARTGISGRAVREIVSQADGVDVLVSSFGKDGYRLALSRGDAAPHTAKLRSQSIRMARRADRRDAFAERFPPDAGPSATQRALGL